MNVERVIETSYMLDSEEGRIDANMNNKIRLLLEPDKTNNYYKCANTHISRLTLVFGIYSFVLFVLFENMYLFYLVYQFGKPFVL